MQLSYREVSPNDLATFYELCAELKQEQVGVAFARIDSKRDLISWISDERTHLYGLFSEKIMLGVLKAEQGEPGKQHSCYLSAALGKNYRGQGLSKKLLDFGLSELAKEGIIVARAKVYSTNVASISMLLSLGFTWAGTIHKHQWDEKRHKYIDDLIFHKEITSR